MRVECPSARSRDEAAASLFLFAQTMKRIVACVLVALAALVKRHSPTLAELIQALQPPQRRNRRDATAASSARCPRTSSRSAAPPPRAPRNAFRAIGIAPSPLPYLALKAAVLRATWTVECALVHAGAARPHTHR